MPLVKELCVRCHDARRFRRWAKQPAKERDWARGRVACVAVLDRLGPGCSRYARVADGPPDECPYLLEHMLMGRPS